MSGSVAAAKSYYGKGLGQGDYYTGAELPGLWRGKAAAMLGLGGEITERQFHVLCDNLRPDTGGKLNLRVNRDRRVGYDMVFSAPKSISILHGVIGDDRILDAFRRAVGETMTAIEADAHVRVRKNGADIDRKTGNLVWGEFVHTTSRPVDERSAPDPNLHAHAYCFNTSWDPVEKRFKAGQFFQIKRDAPYFEAVFHCRLAREMQALGYQIENRPFSFEVRGIGQENIDRFSRRAKEIDALAAELGIIDNAKAKDGLAARSRRKKHANFSLEEIRRDWLTRLDRDSLSYRDQNPEPVPAVSPREAVDYALAVNFERRSVVSRRRLLTSALQFCTGDCKPGEIIEEFDSRGEIVTGLSGGELCATTEGIIEQEEEVLETLRSSQGRLEPLNADYISTSEDGDQKAAIEALLRSRDRVFVIEGRAGTGKTTLMREAIAAIGRRVSTFAPTSEAAHKVLRQEGFEKSDTVQQLLVNNKLQEEQAYGVIWVDEAGLLSVGEINQLMSIAEDRDARLILSGDTRQHHSVSRGDGLRLVTRSGLVEVRQTRTVYRQRNARYRSAIEAISEGRLMDGVSILDEIGAIREHTDLEDRCQAIGREYLGSPDALVVSPTHAEAELATAEIRRQLKAAGKLIEEIEVASLKSRILTEAERGQALFLRAGDVVRFHQNAKGGIRKGESLRIEHISADGRVWLDCGDQLRQLDLAAANRYDVLAEVPLRLAIGDKIRLTRNVVTQKRRLYNGSVHTVAGFKNGQPVIDGGLQVPGGSFAYGYVATSHSSQGKTRNKVIISQSSLSSGAASLEQFYVSASRGRDEVVVFTDSKTDLISQTQRSEERLLATELKEHLAAVAGGRHGGAAMREQYPDREQRDIA